MLKFIRKALKHSLRLLPDSYYARMITYYPALRRWQSGRVGSDTPRFDHRERLYDHIIAQSGAGDLLFLEFGCHAGRSLRYWAENCTGNSARFVGFDTFTGLPEKWQGMGRTADEGMWGLDGKPPTSDDPRVSYVKGLFQDSLPGFVSDGRPLDSGRPLIIHMDADLYSSTLFVLTYLSEYLPGAIVIFDEFDSAFDEFRALEDYCSAYRRSYEVLAVTDWCEHVAIRFDRAEIAASANDAAIAASA